MITRGKRVAVTCPHCERSFEFTDAIVNAGIGRSIREGLEKGLSRLRLADAPTRFECPHCKQRSTQAALMGDAVEPFNARGRAK